MAHEFTVEFEEQDDGPEPALRERFGVVASHRLSKLDEDGKAYPKAGDEFDFMDAFEGPYVWEMTDAQFEATPPTLVGAEVVSVEPSEPTDGPVRVVARVVF
ncbi:MAG: hypothetical protein ABL886_09045 [Rhodoglobus sp.]